MKAKSKAKWNIFTLLGWLLWKVLALFGSRWAKKKLEQRRNDRKQAEAGPVKRGLRTLGSRRS